MPQAAVIAMNAISDALYSGKNPRTTFNRKLVSHIPSKPWLYARLADWLQSQHVLDTARRSGAYWALRKWQVAVEQMRNGVTPHEAFGMAKAGRRKNQGFTNYEDAALLAEYFHRVQGKPRTAADSLAGERVSISLDEPLDPSRIGKFRRRLGSVHDEDLSPKARLILKKIAAALRKRGLTGV